MNANRNDIVEALYSPSEQDVSILKDTSIAHLIVHHNKVLGANLVDGLKIDIDETSDGIDARISVEENKIIIKPVHICFGMLPEEGIQKIVLDIGIRSGASVSILAHCVFPNAVNVQHIMDAKIRVGENANYSYFERHVHGLFGGVKVYPRAKVNLEQYSRFKTEFELLKGRVGLIEIDYETTCEKYSVMEMTARINGKGDDLIKIHETGHLIGEYARGVLTSRIAIRDRASAMIFNKLTAHAPFARGHVDCKEIVQDKASASAIPEVVVTDPKAHVTHEAAIGSVDSKQLETLMSRGLSEDEAVELIINGLLS